MPEQLCPRCSRPMEWAGQYGYVCVTPGCPLQPPRGSGAPAPEPPPRHPHVVVDDERFKAIMVERDAALVAAGKAGGEAIKWFDFYGEACLSRQRLAGKAGRFRAERDRAREEREAMRMAAMAHRDAKYGPGYHGPYYSIDLALYAAAGIELPEDLRGV